jgi:hypothetical protein
VTFDMMEGCRITRRIQCYVSYWFASARCAIFIAAESHCFVESIPGVGGGDATAEATEVDFRKERRINGGRLIWAKDVVPQNPGERQADVNSYAGRAMAVQPYHMASCRYFHRLYDSFARQAPVPFPLLSPVSW